MFYVDVYEEPVASHPQLCSYCLLTDHAEWCIWNDTNWRGLSDEHMDADRSEQSAEILGS